MELLNAFKKRYSCRSYLDREVPEEVLDAVMDIGGNAPVGNHRYNTLHFTCVTNKELLEDVRRSATNNDSKQDPMYGCPVVIFVSSSQYPDPFAYQDAACALDHMGLAALEYGLDSVYLYGFIKRMDDEELIKRFELPEGFHLVAGIGLGYAASEHQPKSKLVSEVSINKI